MSPLFGRGGGDGSDRSRSSASREQARRDREARRAAREGREAPDFPPLDDEQLPDVPPAGWEDADAHAPEDFQQYAEEHPVEYAEEVAHPEDVPSLDPEPVAPAGDPGLDAPGPIDTEPPPDPQATAAWDAMEEDAANDEGSGAAEPAGGAEAGAPEPAATDGEAPVPDAEPPAAPAAEPRRRPVIPPRPALSWETEDAAPVRQDPPTSEQPVTRAAPADPAPAYDYPPAEDDPSVRRLDGEDDGDRPLGTRRVAASTLASAAGADGPPRFGAPPSGGRGRGRGLPRTRRGVARVGPIVVVVFLLVVLYGVNKVFQPFHGAGKGHVRVVISQGDGAREIGDQLAKAGVIDNGFIFSVRARLSGDRDKLRSGPHDLKKDMSYGDALKALIAVPTSAPTVDVAVPEGLTIKQIASLAHQAQLRGSFTKATQTAAVRTRARALGMPQRAKTIEGFLFPATYRLRTTATTATLVSEMLKTYARQTKAVDYRYAKSKNLTRYDVLTIASLIENEAQTSKDRPLIAAVIYNRLKQGIPLQIDATTRYETGNYGANARPIRQSELDADTSYNTRIRKGLPPTPISSPGLASLRAAARPAKVDYLYYVVKPCGNGAHNFSATDAKFQRDREAYDRKREELGGRDPSRC